jgi:hypothetical protein
MKNNKKYSRKIKKIKGGKTLKSKKCSPYAEKVKINSKSCLSRSVILKLRNSYNNNNKNKIKQRNTQKIWEELKKNKPQCESEMCWINEIKNQTVKKNILDVFYAPKQPKEWKKNPDEWLSNFDILDVLKQYEFNNENFKFIGPTPINFMSPDIKDKKTCVWKELCKFNLQEYITNKVNKIGVIFNLAKQGDPGTHWVSLFIDLKRNFILFFDSNGDPPPKEVKQLINTINSQGKKNNINFKNVINNLEHQQSNSECGMYSLYFIVTLVTEKIDNVHIDNTDLLISHFTKKRIPDQFVFKHRSIYFNE